MKALIACLTGVACLSPLALVAQNAGDIGSYSATVFIGRNQVDNIDDFANTAMLSGRSVAAGIAFDDVTMDGEPGRLFESSVDNISALAGYFHEWEGFQAGVLAAYADVSIAAGPAAGNNNSFSTELEGSGFNLAVAGRKSWDQWNLSGLLGFGSRSYDGIRQFVPPSPNQPLPKASSFDTNTLFFRLTLSYLYQMSEAWIFRPFVVGGYETAETDPFEESDVSGNAGDVADIDGFENQATFIEVGAVFEYDGFDGATPTLALSYFQDLGDDELELSWENPPISSSSTIPNAGQSLFLGALGVNAALGDAWMLSGQADFQSGDSYSGFGASVVFDYGF